MSVITRREEEKIEIATPAGHLIELVIVRSRNGAVSLSVELPHGYHLNKPIEGGSYGMALAGQQRQDYIV